MEIYNFEECRQAIVDADCTEYNDTENEVEGIGDKIAGFFRKFQDTAKEMLGDDEKVESTLDEFENKVAEIPGIGLYMAYVPRMISMVRSFIKGEYTQVPIAHIIAIIAGIVYVVAPVDAIPDLIPVIGWLDDMTVLNMVVGTVAKDTDDYEEWKEKQDVQVSA